MLLRLDGFEIFQLVFRLLKSVTCKPAIHKGFVTFQKLTVSDKLYDSMYILAALSGLIIPVLV